MKTRRENAAAGVGARHGVRNERTEMLTARHHKTQRRTTLSIAPIWSDDGALVGWDTFAGPHRNRFAE